MLPACTAGPFGSNDHDGVLTVFYWQDEPDYERAWWWDDDYEPTEERGS